MLFFLVGIAVGTLFIFSKINQTKIESIKIQEGLKSDISEFNLKIIELKNNYIRESIKKSIDNKYGKMHLILKNIKEKYLLPDAKRFLFNWQKYVINSKVHNSNYINRELSECSTLLSNIDGRSLDNQQRYAVVVDEDNELVVAGAGAGKTLTIAGKVAYLVKRKKVVPKNILLITFTKKAAEEMKERVIDKLGIGVEVSTFHSLGLKLISEVMDKKPNIEENSERILTKYMENEVSKKPEIFRKFVEFFAIYLNHPQNTDKFKTMGDFFSSNKHLTFKSLKGTFDDILNGEEKKESYNEFNDEELRLILLMKYEYILICERVKVEIKKLEDYKNTLEKKSRKELIDLITNQRKIQNKLEESELKKDIDELKEKYSKMNEKELFDFFWNSENKTYQGERVKSVEELLIANFLFVNGVKYEYERFYPHDKGTKDFQRYKPDFYLPEYDIYIEHFGVDELENPPKFFNKIESQKYKEGMKWKRALHEMNKTKLVETYSYYQKNGILIPKLEEILKKNGVKFNPMEMEELLKYKDQLKKRTEFMEFIKIINTFLKLFKSNGYGISKLKDFRNKAHRIDNTFVKERELLFFEIFEPIYLYYQKELEKEELIDFDDMIINATLAVSKINLEYKYIIIDEYQDISNSRFKLIKKIKEKTDATIMAVGDDWQSIYRFAGSDIDLFTNFEKYFGKSEIVKIEKTYRNSQQIIDVAGSFVMKNEIQIKKSLKSDKSKIKPILILGYETNKVAAFSEALSRILKGNSNKSILVLGRNYSDIMFLENNEFFNLSSEKGKTQIKTPLYPNTNIIFMTIHKSKGLEGDDVIIINNDNKLTGFPNKIADDEILRYVLVEKENFDYGEERRLFYVALTRTRNTCILLTPILEQSVFIDELREEGIDYEELEIVESIKCPRCQTGNLRINKNLKNKTPFISCSHYPQCNFISPKIEIIRKPVPCPWCGGYLIKRSGTYGEFLGCLNYPHCKNTQVIADDK